MTGDGEPAASAGDEEQVSGIVGSHVGVNRGRHCLLLHACLAWGVQMWLFHFNMQEPGVQRRKRRDQLVEDSEDEGTVASAAHNTDAAGAGAQQHGSGKRQRRMPSHLSRDYHMGGR